MVSLFSNISIIAFTLLFAFAFIYIASKRDTQLTQQFVLRSRNLSQRSNVLLIVPYSIYRTRPYKHFTDSDLKAA
jgi:energy-converting hydrogenase Eha subunit H